MRGFNEIFRKNVSYDNIKSNEKAGLYPSLENKVLEVKLKRQIKLSNFFRVKNYLLFNQLKNKSSYVICFLELLKYAIKYFGKYLKKGFKNHKIDIVKKVNNDNMKPFRH